MCVRACDIALRKCYGVLYLVCEMDLFYSIHIATYRSLCQVDCCFFFLSSSVVWHAIIDRYRYLFSYRILQTTRNQTQHLQDKMCVIKKTYHHRLNKIGKRHIASLSQCFWISATIEIPSSIVMIIWMIFIQTKMLGYIPLLPHALQLKQ